MIVKACTAGDLLTVQSLFASGQASPCDRIWGDRSLLDLIQMQVTSTISSYTSETSHQRLPGLVATYAELVRCGLDPGVPRANIDIYERSPLSALSNLQIMSPADAHYIVLLARVMITSSIQDPLLGADIEKLVWQEKIAGRKMPLYELLRTQEEWPISWPSDDEVLIARCSKLHRAYAYHSDVGPEIYAEFYALEYDQICCMVNPAPFRFLLQICQHWNEALTILATIEQFFESNDIPGRQKLDEDRNDRLSGRIRDCLNSCLEHGLDLNNPPVGLYSVLKRFRIDGKVNIIDSAMLSLGIPRELATDLLEAELYSSMAYQLSSLGVAPFELLGQRGHSWNFIPRELRYTSSPNDNDWYGYLETLTTMSGVSETEVTPVENMSNHESSEEDSSCDEEILHEEMSDDEMSDEEMSDEEMSDEEMSYEEMSDEEMSYESQSDEYTNTSDEDASHEDMYFLEDLIRRGYVKNLYQCGNSLSEVTIDDALLEINAFTIESPFLPVGFNAMSVEEPLEPPDSKQNPELLAELRNSGSSSVLSAKIGEDDASSIWSELLDSFDAECQDDLQERGDITMQDLEMPSAYETVATAYNIGTDMIIDTLEEDAGSDDSSEDRLDGLSLALNAFWT
ncbi:hypothetical protein GLAREA_09318 [Glarea lozoyensis ATCC 20868]|uniref:Uncharacterized protein n=2 Tax=Glarea lozoyensis TaxID=101852 RepID=S3DHI9_GLAL2|nr:uncharacterized protein GLAREA_09318 [Glarea lozoyensis ATCC 20868]EPE37155.1 hypothetical protein GLAREA_09318 [Glarea lozoyensis ATCC 20868]